GDLIDRAIFLRLRPILGANRRREEDFWAEFYLDYPKLLGALLDAVSGGLRLAPDVDIPELPRMADAASWGEAVIRGLGCPPGISLNAYHKNRQAASVLLMDDSSVTPLLMEPIRGAESWNGTASDLLSFLTEKARLRGVRAASLPKSPSALSSALRRMA